MSKLPGWRSKGQGQLAHQMWKRISNPMYQPSDPKEYQSPEAYHSPSKRPVLDVSTLYQERLETWQAAKMIYSSDVWIIICPPSQTNHRSWDVQLSEELIRTAFLICQSCSMPLAIASGSAWWRRFTQQNRFALQRCRGTVLPEDTIR